MKNNPSEAPLSLTEALNKESSYGVFKDNSDIRIKQLEQELTQSKKLTYKYYGESEQLKIDKKYLEQELQKTREHLYKADELLREVELLIRYDGNKPSHENPNKFILDHAKYFKDKQGE